MSDTFQDYLDNQKRARLRELGCFEAAGTLYGRMMWRLPDGTVVPEWEAFVWLEAREGGEHHD